MQRWWRLSDLELDLLLMNRSYDAPNLRMFILFLYWAFVEASPLPHSHCPAVKWCRPKLGLSHPTTTVWCMPHQTNVSRPALDRAVLPLGTSAGSLHNADWEEEWAARDWPTIWQTRREGRDHYGRGDVLWRCSHQPDHHPPWDTQILTITVDGHPFRGIG